MKPAITVWAAVTVRATGTVTTAVTCSHPAASITITTPNPGTEARWALNFFLNPGFSRPLPQPNYRISRTPMYST